MKQALAESKPVISVDTKKKELIGDFKNNGREYRPKGDPEAVRVHDFLIKELGNSIATPVATLALPVVATVPQTCWKTGAPSWI